MNEPLTEHRFQYMNRFLFAIAVGTLIAIPTALENRAQAQTADPHSALVKTYCAGCHSIRLKTGGLALEGLNLDSPSDDAQVWEKVLRKLRGHQMPPPGTPQPKQQDVDSFVAWMENTLDTNPKGPKAGYVPIQRLNRTEYAAAVKALVGVEVNPKEVLPQDIQVEGFDNIATALSVSPAFLDQYVAAARHVARTAVGSANPRVSAVKYPIATNQSPDNPPPPGTRGGVRFKHDFPTDGEYRITIPDLGVGPYSNALENENTMVITIDGKVAVRKEIGGHNDLALVDRKAGTGRTQVMDRFSKMPVHVKAGVHDVVVAFIERSDVENDENFDVLEEYNGLTGSQAVLNRMARLGDGIEVAGPFNPTGISKTPSRALIFVCDPKPAEELSCARQITENLARRAFRRPVTKEDMTRLMPFYEAGRKNGGTFDQGIEQIVAAVLVSPQFLYRDIKGPVLTDLELASRLSFFLWNAGPDDELLSLASANGLTRPGVVEKEVRRMLADPKASSLATSFALKWLNLTDLDQVVPDPVLFPSFSEPLRHDFLKETEEFVANVFSEDRSVLELLNADYTFVNDRLAKHYGMKGITGSQFRKVSQIPPERYGLLGKAAIQLRTSYGDRTSPVLRGAWVLDKLNGTPPTPPPPDTATDLSQKAGEQPKTVRARLEQHRNKQTCNMCHGVIDPTGLALENFDAIGQWRTTDAQAKLPIDAKTVLPTGVAIDGVVELRAQLAAHPETFVRTFTERLMMYGVNRQLEYYDMPQIRAIVHHSAKDNYKLSSLILGIVNSDSFRNQGFYAGK
jgi:mono/diheme cytochrome c family protein